jgi:hypothetical protein
MAEVAWVRHVAASMSQPPEVVASRYCLQRRGPLSFSPLTFLTGRKDRMRQSVRTAGVVVLSLAALLVSTPKAWAQG